MLLVTEGTEEDGPKQILAYGWIEELLRDKMVAGPPAFELICDGLLQSAVVGYLEDSCCLATLLSRFSWRYGRRGHFGGHCCWEGKGELGEGGKHYNHGGPHWLCFAQGCVVEQVLGLVIAVCVIPHVFGGDRELVSILMLYRDVGRAVDEEAG